MKKLFRPYLALTLMGSLVAFSSCDDHDHEPHDHDQELITTMTLTMTPQDGGSAVTATFRDVDGPGGQNPVMTPEQVVLDANTTYVTNITLLNEANDHGHPEDVTEEVENEGTDHELFFVPSPADLLTVTKTDRDANNRPIGLESTIQTGAAQSGTLRVVLKHQPGGLKSDNSNINTGETDIDVTYNIAVQ